MQDARGLDGLVRRHVDEGTVASLLREHVDFIPSDASQYLGVEVDAIGWKFPNRQIFNRLEVELLEVRDQLVDLASDIVLRAMASQLLAPMPQPFQWPFSRDRAINVCVNHADGIVQDGRLIGRNSFLRHVDEGSALCVNKRVNHAEGIVHDGRLIGRRSFLHHDEGSV